MSVLTVLIPVIVDKIFDRLVKDPYIPVSPVDETITKPEIEKVVTEELKPVIEHLTNNEPWYKSRVMWGSILGIAGGLVTIGTHLANGIPIDTANYGPPAASIVGGVGAILGRFFAKKPIGA